MSYIVCRNCKKFVKVDEKAPLNFDKCDKCGHTLEFAGNDTELNMMLNDIVIPKISYQKVCASCKKLNPRETAACLHCGSTKLQLQYDMESIQNSQNLILNKNEQPTQTIIIRAGSNFNPRNSILFRLFSLIIGLIDFFFFALLGIQLLWGSEEIPADLMAFATQNVQPLMIIICISLILAGIMSVMIIPKMSYRDSLETSSTVGMVIGLITLIASKDLLTVVISIVFCSILSGIGGLIGEYIIHKLTSHFNQ